jgi:hypothetical protein
MNRPRPLLLAAFGLLTSVQAHARPTVFTSPPVLTPGQFACSALNAGSRDPILVDVEGATADTVLSSHLLLLDPGQAGSIFADPDGEHLHFYCRFTVLDGRKQDLRAAICVVAQAGQCLEAK